MLKGNRNQRDGLWDIPIIKLNVNNYIKPKSHASIYPNKNLIKNKSYNAPFFLQHLNIILYENKQQNPYTKSKPSPISNIPSFLQHLNPIVDENSLDNDTTYFKKLDHKANVIIQKKQTQCELA